MCWYVMVFGYEFFFSRVKMKNNEESLKKSKEEDGYFWVICFNFGNP